MESLLCLTQTPVMNLQLSWNSFFSASQNTDELGCICFTLLKINIISVSVVSTLYFASIISSVLCSYLFAVANLSTPLQHHNSPGEVQGLGTRSTGVTGFQKFWLRTFLSRLEPAASHHQKWGGYVPEVLTCLLMTVCSMLSHILLIRTHTC